MGQNLSEPVTTKESASCANKNFCVGSSCMQGWRKTMEDAHTHLLSLPDDPSTAFFAVYDGHGGAKVSQYAGINLHKEIVSIPEYQEGNIEAALKKGFLSLDEKMRADESIVDDMSGTTAVVVLVRRNTIFCANVGDSRAVVSVCGVAKHLSHDHKPALENEAARIVAAGGWVEFNRVNGNLALSRALGDFIYKKNTQKSAEEQLVIAYPDVIVDEITDDHEFIVLACDGIWDVMSNQEVISFCRDRLAAKREPQVICEELLTRCLAPDCQMAGLGCDNMTVVLVCLTRGSDENAFAEKCQRASPISTSPSLLLPNSTETEANDATEDQLNLKNLKLSKDEATPAETSNVDPHSESVSSPSEYLTPDPSPQPHPIDDDELPPTQFTVLKNSSS